MPFDYADPALPPPLDLSHHLSHTTRARGASSIKAFYKYFAIPNIRQLAGGLPNPEYFPFDTLEAAVAVPERFEPTPNEPPPPGSLAALSLQDGGAQGRMKSSAFSSSNDNSPFPPRRAPGPPPTSRRLLVPHLLDPNTTTPPTRIDVASALQYGQAQGYPPLLSWVRSLTRHHMHRRIPYAGGPDVVLTCGNTDGFNKALLAFSDEWRAGIDPAERREGILVEEFCYMAAVGAARPRGLNVVPVRMDAHGIRPADLERVLAGWDPRRGKRPHLLYTVSVGQNPTGGTLPLDRKRAVYALCSRYDVLIVEDEPYWYLQYPSSPSFAAPPPPAGGEGTGDAFMDALVPSYLALDADGRVVRLDTFSKTVAPGCRLGWITAQPALVERLLRVTEATTQQPSGFVQAAVAELVLGPDRAGGRGGRRSERWDFAGFSRWLSGLRGAYERRMTALCAALEAGATLPPSSAGGQGRGSGEGEDEEWTLVPRPVRMYSFTPPSAGMFLWLRVHFEAHPLWSQVDTSASPSHAPAPAPARKYKPLTPTRLSLALFTLLTRPPTLTLLAPGSIFAVDDDPEVVLPVEAGAGAEAWRFFRACFAAAPEREVREGGVAVGRCVRALWGLGREEVEELLEEWDEDDDGAEKRRVVRGDALDLGGFC